VLFDNEVVNNFIKNYLDKEFESYGDIKYAYAIMNKKNTTEMRVFLIVQIGLKFMLEIVINILILLLSRHLIGLPPFLGMKIS